MKENLPKMHEAVTSMVENLSTTKQEFYDTYKGNSHIQEFLPVSKSELFPINDDHLKKLHEFADMNPIYYNSFELKISEIPYIVYEGDINDYWINSLKHDLSYQPFYPTWIISAYLMALESKNLNYRELIDIGSGDGRIAFCGAVVGLTSSSIEIDQSLVDLQNQITSKTSVDFSVYCFDATKFDYMSLDLKKPIFFVGGLPQLGEMLANSIISQIDNIHNLKQESCFVLAGTNSQKQFSGNPTNGGWEKLIEKFRLQITKTLTVPTSWTFDQQFDTQYLFTKF